ncbi:MAG TPA: zf-TFIIB domain-containing protein [Rhodoglobus sp.]|nr:zf-TFIIB domain-containing protein [Rhodoglobus sp.]
MKCPNDDATLIMSERSGIEIDYCPQCRGVWLDRGELDKIIERAGTGAPAATAQFQQPAQPQAPAYQQPPAPQYGDRDRGYGDRGYGYQQQPYRKKKENWLSELFD